ncbi:MAG: glycosyltransferase family 9 protein [Acidobacteria bacterium]|nr:glycosyltransferase family 9 protein [Acidobacteriota bacterium]
MPSRLPDQGRHPGDADRRGDDRALIARILLIRLREIGDVVFTTPAIRGLRTRFPRAHLAYLVEPHAAPLVARNPLLDDVIVAPRRGLAADLALAGRLRARRFDLAIDFHGGPRASLLAWLSGAPARLGYQVAGRSWMYTRRVARPRALRPRHSVENQWDLLAALGIPAPDPAECPVEMAVDAAVARDVDRRLAEAGAGPADRLIVIHVSAGNPFRRWPIESFAALAAALAAADPRRRVLLTSGPSDAAAAIRALDQARGQLPEGDRERIMACGDFSLAELRALVDRAALFIGGDSGPLHVAATSAVPIVGLYGPTLPARSAPWRAPALISEAVEIHDLPCRPCDQRVCAPGDFRCLARVTPSQVAEAAERALSRAGARRS